MREASSAYQIGVAQAVSAYAGRFITDVKAHGALGNLAQTDAEVAAERCVRMVRAGVVETIGGNSLPVQVDSICVHSDTPTAVAVATAVRAALEADGVRLQPFAAG